MRHTRLEVEFLQWTFAHYLSQELHALHDMSSSLAHTIKIRGVPLFLRSPSSDVKYSPNAFTICTSLIWPSEIPGGSDGSQDQGMILHRWEEYRIQHLLFPCLAARRPMYGRSALLLPWTAMDGLGGRRKARETKLQVASAYATRIMTSTTFVQTASTSEPGPCPGPLLSLVDTCAIWEKSSLERPYDDDIARCPTP